MNKNTLLVMGGVAAVLAGYVVYSGTLKREEQRQVWGAERKEEVFFAGIQPADIGMITIEREGEKPVVLIRDADTEWSVRTKWGNRSVDESRERRILNNFGNTPELSKDMEAPLQAEQATSHEAFGLLSKDAPLIRFADPKGKDLEKFHVGKRGNRPNTTYVRRAGSDATYLLPADLSDNFAGNTVSDWREKGAFDPPLTQATITNLKFEHSVTTRSFELKKAPLPGKFNEWTLITHDGRQEPANMDSVNAALASLEGLRASKFLDEGDKAAELEPFRYRLTIGANDTTTSISLTVGKESDAPNQYYAKSNLRPDEFLVFDLFSLNRPPQDFIMQAPPPTPVPDQVTDVNTITPDAQPLEVEQIPASMLPEAYVDPTPSGS